MKRFHLLLLRFVYNSSNYNTSNSLLHIWNKNCMTIIPLNQVSSISNNLEQYYRDNIIKNMTLLNNQVNLLLNSSKINNLMYKNTISTSWNQMLLPTKKQNCKCSWSDVTVDFYLKFMVGLHVGHLHKFQQCIVCDFSKKQLATFFWPITNYEQCCNTQMLHTRYFV